MRFSIIATLTFALGAIAAPQVGGQGRKRGENGTTVAQAQDVCGQDFDLSCCNEASQSGDSDNEADGLLSGLLGGVLGNGKLGLFDGCSKLSVTALIGVDDLLNSQCKQTAACCQHSGSEQEGLVNVGLPCVALGGLL
ncbi:fungal hydrophobin-domain-containing protein [Xylariaceae sp. FL1019]|nr:fungal hydrophobin-domain-containing protein [Xylariaceae sp. FL1019]